MDTRCSYDDDKAAGYYEWRDLAGDVRRGALCAYCLRALEAMGYTPAPVVLTIRSILNIENAAEAA